MRSDLIDNIVTALRGRVQGRGTCALCDYQEMSPDEPCFEEHEVDCAFWRFELHERANHASTPRRLRHHDALLQSFCTEIAAWAQAKITLDDLQVIFLEGVEMSDGKTRFFWRHETTVAKAIHILAYDIANDDEHEWSNATKVSIFML